MHENQILTVMSAVATLALWAAQGFNRRAPGEEFIRTDEPVTGSL